MGISFRKFIKVPLFEDFGMLMKQTRKKLATTTTFESLHI